MKMIRQFMLAAIVLSMFSCTQSPQKGINFSINAEVSNFETGQITLLRRVKGQYIALDSVQVADGRFTFSNSLPDPQLVYLKLEGKQSYVSFFIDEGDIAVVIDAEDLTNPKVTGSPNQEIYAAYLDAMRKFDERLSAIYSRYLEAQQAGNQELMDEMNQYYETENQNRKEHTLAFIMNHVNTPVAAFITLRNIYMLELGEMEQIDSAIDPSMNSTIYVEDFRQRLERLRNVQIGMPAPDFIMNDSLGNPVALSSLYGQYLFVDFWAAWCGPCRRENPNIVAAYEKYHEKGFDILGVSLDTDRDRWIKAIHDDNLTWHHVSDLAGWSNAAAALYAVNSIPSSVLLNPEGIIIERNLKGEDLHRALEKIFNKELAAE